jgi:dTDP-4-amino-4,6-dideoxygalactose transaminase
MITIAKPAIGKEEEREVLKVLRSGMIAQGRWVERFEKEFAKYIGTKYAIQTTSGTTALHLALLALGIGNGDEVITTPFTFVATSNAILYTGARPVFVDIDENTFNIDPDLIEKKITKRTKAILVVHLYGLPADMTKINKIAKKYHIDVIEDAAQAHGATYKNRKVGSIGKLGCFSFYATKNMTTGEGGMVTTNSYKLAQKVRALRNHGMIKLDYKYPFLGYNYCPTNMAAALGLTQLKKLDSLNAKRERNAKYFISKLKNTKGIVLPKLFPDRIHVFHQFTIRVTKDFPISRELLIKHFEKNGIIPKIYYPIALHKQKLYRNIGYKDSLPVSERVTKEVLSIPVHPSLPNKDLEKIIKTFSV